LKAHHFRLKAPRHDRQKQQLRFKLQRVVDISIERAGPLVSTIRRADQLRSNSHVAPGAPHTAFHHERNAELCTNASDVIVLAFKLK